ncbi:MAG TPA: epoxide hydrolase [Candidatus Limnocylindrales bacterium]
MAFSIRIADGVLADLKSRIEQTRWPEPIPGVTWEQGTDIGYLKALLDYWAKGFDWPTQQAWLNSFPQESTTIDGVAIHFVHAPAARGQGIPLILTHGWPSTFVEYLPLVPLLTDPQAHGIDGPAFDLVIPSLPGYGFSGRPPRLGVNYRYVADLWHRLMSGLGYSRFGAGGGDFGAGVATFMAADIPKPVMGIHLTNFEIPPPEDTPWTAAESAYLATNEAWAAVERGYSAIQSTKPQTVGIGLNDSPAGLAAWVLEKWRSWTDSGGDLDARFGRDFLLTMLTIYWATGTIATSMRDYYDNRWHAVDPGFVEVPTAFAVFANEFVREGEPPREWMERLYNIRRWTVMPRGGHFAPAEEPALVAQDIATFFGGL